tara:strand:- start:111 stop:374 length:264 start_codon:yes stop_codon:yes gene_type:complete
MGTKHNKKRFLIVKYTKKPDGKFDELVELSKKKIGAGKMTEAAVVLDLHNKKILKMGLDDAPKDLDYKQVLEHYKKFYADAIDQFLK